MDYLYKLVIGMVIGYFLVKTTGIFDKLLAKKRKKMEQQLQADLKEQEAVWERASRETAINAAWFRLRHTSQRTRRKPAFKRIITHTPKEPRLYHEVHIKDDSRVGSYMPPGGSFVLNSILLDDFKRGR